MSKFGFGDKVNVDKTSRRMQKAERKGIRRANRIARYKDRQARSAGFDRGLGILSLVALVLLCAGIIGNLTTGNVPSFGGLLEAMRSAPSIDFSDLADSSIISTIGGDWGIIDSLRRFINNYIIKALNGVYTAANYTGKALMNCIYMFTYIVGWLFGV